jgi:TonB family protein
LQAKIRNAWSIPPQSKGLQASVFLIVNRAGQVEQTRLVQGSGNALFDESLQRAIKQAQPLPALPEDYGERSLEVTLRFRGQG